MSNILIIDDDPDIGQLLKRFLTKNRFKATSVLDGRSGVELLKVYQYDLILCDYKLPDTDGLEMIQKIKILNPHAIVIIITGYSDIQTAVNTLRQGAFDFIIKPLYPDEILLKIKEAIYANQEKMEASGKPGLNNAIPEKEYIYGTSPQSRQVQNHINLISPTDMTVIIVGETGTGKEFVARSIHQKSERAAQPFVAIDCGAISQELAGSELFGHVKGAFTGALGDKVGSFETANRGTLFLDEIGNLSYDNQIRLLRVLQERKIKRLGSNSDLYIDVRMIVATNENLKEAVNQQKFREDIYHRLNEFKIELSPLRERLEDILIFANHFLILANRQLNKNVKSFDRSVIARFKSYSWYGNLRELQNVIKRAVLLCNEDMIRFKHLPEEFNRSGFEDSHLFRKEKHNQDDLKYATKNAERMVILEALKKTGYNKTKAARILNIDRKTLYNKLKAIELNTSPE